MRLRAARRRYDKGKALSGGKSNGCHFGLEARSVSENYSIHKALLFQYLQPRILQITK